MGVKTYSEEIESPIVAPRLFKALCLDNHNAFPKLMPESFKRFQYKYANHRIDELDVANFYYKHTTIGGDLLEGKYECVINETKFYLKGSGCVGKMTTHVHPLPRTEFNEEGPKMGQEKMRKIFKTVEEYLVVNPNAH
ncbi:hypothetical protein Ancab_018615 [Ancistrocladus abbreviatus]